CARGLSASGKISWDITRPATTLRHFVVHCAVTVDCQHASFVRPAESPLLPAPRTFRMAQTAHHGRLLAAVRGCQPHTSEGRGRNGYPYLRGESSLLRH